MVLQLNKNWIWKSDDDFLWIKIHVDSTSLLKSPGSEWRYAVAQILKKKACMKS